MDWSLNFFSLFFLLILGKVVEAEGGTKTEQEGRQSCSAQDGTAEDSSCQQPHLPLKKYIFHDCRLYLAKSTVPNVNVGLFSSTRMRQGQPIAPPDIIIQLTDYITQLNNSPLIADYSWDPYRFGGQFEAKNVASILPGVGSIANAMTNFQDANAIPFGARDVDEANVPRTTSAGAGSFTHYHNVTFFASRDIEAGDEIFVYYGEKDWYHDRVEKIKKSHDAKDDGGKESSTHGSSVDWLKDNGICMDNLLPGKSRIKGAGRGAFASRLLPKGSVVSSTPLVHLHRNATKTKKVKHGGKNRKIGKQLLSNYLLEQADDSSILSLPLSPLVNLINHGDEPNVRLQWSSSNPKDETYLEYGAILTPEEIIKNPRLNDLQLEYIAIREILPGEEIILHYGSGWVQDWQEHKKEWAPVANAQAYSPSYIMDDVAGLIRTEKEQATHPYPENTMTGCFYRYSTHEKSGGITAGKQQKGEATTVKWKMDRRTFEYDNLRPCNVMQRDEINGQVAYTAMIKNWQGLTRDEMIPKGEIHVVNSIPRQAIRFIDKMYSTDQHLPNSFRHSIQIPVGNYIRQTSKN
mmetsp:Transcript_29448/g.44947  ORF Transcript_29448/g.44947 Transcript_29448/m.44947 type:complete len:576 (+) Transcript_29448:110-1837(+)